MAIKQIQTPAISPKKLISGGVRSQGVVVHALHKSATMFLYKFFKRLSERQGYSFFSANNDPPNELSDVLESQPRSGASLAKFCCCPVRTFDFQRSLDADSKIVRIFHVRDPRDMLVSEFFSFGWSHTTENTELNERRREIQRMSVDEYAIRQPEFSSWPLEEKFAPLLQYELDPSREILVKYETMVTRFSAWVSQVLRPFEVRLPAIAVAKLAWKYRHEFQPTGQGSHTRAITPGDHRRQLQPATIKALNERYQDILQTFGYDL